ncbi:unnamed protein product [Durusdinium trenchii]|uniref:Protein artemis n=1 Tax=Durusdinium trenchii TaxID=1381693 RepID=A0ABP0R1J5_9DINO
MLLEEVPVAVDSFNHDGGVLFFCSHAHEDHLKGLNKKWRKGPLFASAITRQLLLLKWPSLEITALELGRTYQIPLMDGLEIEVYLIDANHVPGSVMFLFFGYFGSVLYTGDFRLHEKHQDIASLAPVRDKGLSRIYLDNTFCDPRFQQPSREDVAAAISKRFRRKWPCIIFVESYRLGKETLLLHLAQKLRSRVLVSEERKKTMRACGFESDQVQIQSCDPLQASEDLLQTEALRGCIWAISRQNLRKGMWQASDSGCAFHGIRATGWAEQARKEESMPSCEDLDENLVAVSDDGVFHYLYSDHCSFLELVQFLQFLPKAPVTFISPVGSSEGTYSFDGADGIQKLMASASVPSIRYSERPTRCFEKTSLPRAKRKAEGPHEEDGYEQKKSAGA